MATTEARLTVEGMKCDGCAQTVRESLMALPAVAEASVSLERKEAVISYDPSSLELAELIKAVEAKGYKAKAR